MAYFANGTEGILLDDQCSKCKYGESPCPIFAIQMQYNYDAVGNKLATEILNCLIKNNGTCEMYKKFKNDFNIS